MQQKNRYEQEGYIVKENIYNAASFGVPQERFRSVVIGMKKRIYITEGYLEPKNYKTVREAIGSIKTCCCGSCRSIGSYA